MKNIFNYHKLPYFVIIFAMLSRIMLINLPMVNNEFAFVDAVNYFFTYDYSLIKTYFYYQANTLGTSYIVYLLSTMFPSIDVITTGRLFSIFCLGLLGISLLLLSDKLEIKNKHTTVLLLVVLFNPLVWIYSGRFTADLAPVSFGIFGLALFFNANSKVSYLMSSLVISVGVVLKYHTLLYLLVAIYCIYKKYGNYRYIALFLIPPVIFLCIYIIIVWIEFDVFIAPVQYQKAHTINFYGWPANIFAYFTYVSLLLMPFTLYIFTRSYLIKQKHERKFMLGVILMLTVVSYLIGEIAGEMNFGPLDKYFSLELLLAFQVLGIIFIYVFSELAVDEKVKNNTILFALINYCFIFIVVFSLSRPAQRYLIYILPLLYIIIFKSYTFMIKKRVVFPLFILFMVLNIYSTLYQYVVGTAAITMADKVISSGYTNVTSFGDILPHVGDVNRSAYLGNTCYKYSIKQGEQDNAIILVDESIGNIVNRIYSLVPTGRKNCNL